MAAQMTKKIIFLELNEVPFQVIDVFVDRNPNSQLAKMLSTSSQYLTVCEDKIQLDPWISWPTLHRGVTDEMHQILHLGQSTCAADNKYPPIWKKLKDAGLKVGVVGSLHSNQHQAEQSQYEFFLPDFFADEAFAHPEYLIPLQRFNLSMTRKSARNVDGKIAMTDALNFVKSAPRLGIGLGTVREISGQLASEIQNSQRRIRRRNTQCTILGDVFLKEVNTRKPDFACFYTNHVAAAMHRYWAAAFPEDQIGPKLDEKWIDTYRFEIYEAMKIFDKLLQKLVKFQTENPDYVIAIASSLGQAAIPTQHCKNYLTITDLDKFMTAMGFSGDQWTNAPTMVPDFTIRMSSENILQLTQKLNSVRLENHRMIQTPARMTHTEIKTSNNRSFIHHHVPIGENFKPPMSFDCQNQESIHINFQWDEYDGDDNILVGNEVVSFAEAGLGFQPHQDNINCSAQHVSEGSLIVYSGSSASTSSEPRREISTLDVAPSILKNYAIDAPGYMNENSIITF